MVRSFRSAGIPNDYFRASRFSLTLPASGFSLNATASSGLTVTYASTTPTACSLSGSTVIPLAAGTCTITASQAGNANYAAATPVTQSFTINPAVVSTGGGGGGAVHLRLPATRWYLSPSVTINAAVGGVPGSQAVTLSYQTFSQGAPTFSSNFNTNQGQGWLSVSPASGTMTQSALTGLLYTYSATVNIVADRPTCRRNTYTGTVNFSSAGGIVSVPVTLNVSAEPAQVYRCSAVAQFHVSVGERLFPPCRAFRCSVHTYRRIFTAAANSTGNWLTAGAGTDRRLDCGRCECERSCGRDLWAAFRSRREQRWPAFRSH